MLACELLCHIQNFVRIKIERFLLLLDCYALHKLTLFGHWGNQNMDLGKHTGVMNNEATEFLTRPPLQTAKDLKMGWCYLL